MIKPLLTAFIFLMLGNIYVNAQIKKEQLVGEWKLSHFINKNISESELKKGYIFSSDSLTYTSVLKNAKGLYKLDEETGQLTWYIADVADPILFTLKYVDANTLQILQPAMNDTIGVLVRKKP